MRTSLETMLVGVGLAVSTLASMAQTRVVDPLAQARQLYNDQRYEAAIESSTAARRVPALAAAATVVFARAHLERFRQTGEATGLEAAREALKSVDTSKLAPRDHVEWLIGLGLSLYIDDKSTLDDRFAGAAELFEAALRRADELDARSRDLLFEWWAMALDRQAQEGPPANRRAVYERILRRAETELDRGDASVSAIYWLAAAARGMDDAQRAWGAAAAGWVRAASLGTRGAALRVDLDKLMAQGILPERARQRTPTGDWQLALNLLEVQWTDFKKRWER